MTILLPFRSAAPWMDTAFSSIAGSTLRDFECLCVNDAADDESVAIVRRFCADDPRFVEVPCVGSGIVAALNTGLRAGRAPIIARMDADDVCHRDRLRLQARWLQTHCDCDLVSTRIEAVWDSPPVDRMARYVSWVNGCLSHDQIVEGLLIESPLPHPSVMFRKERVLDLGGYRAYDGPEDYDLWLRMALAGSRFHKLPEVLLGWRMREGSVSRIDPRCHPDRFFDRKCQYLADLLLSRRGEVKEIVVWGAGRRGGAVGKRLIEAGLPVRGFIDVAPARIGGRRQGLPVHSPHIASARIDGRLYIGAVCSWEGRENIALTLEQSGMRRGKDYLLL